MATIVSIKQKIEQLDAGSFQVLCDAYLSREGYPNPVALGTKAGTQKTTQGTPDTYFCLANGKYVLAEYTTQRPGLAGKIRSDLEKCFDSQLSGINNDDITEIIYCHTSSGIDAGADKSLKRYCQDKGVQLTMIGIDKLAEDISRKYPILAKEHLGLSVDTEQIQDPLDFVRQYDASALAAPLNTNFLFRENEIVRLQKAFDENNVVILSGAAGTGKTRLALEFAERFQKEHTAVKICVIHNHGLPIYDDLKQHFECPGDYFVIVDDANQLSQLDLIIEYVNKKDNGYNVRILATVRNYALQKVKADIAGIVHYSEVTLDSLSDDEIKSLVKDYLGIINIKHKSDAWIKHYISKYNTDYEKMESLFSVLSELCDDRKKDYISYLMTVNADPELFRRIPLCPTSYSWSGSAVPLYSKWADYLKGLLPLFSGIQFLQHQKVVNDEIEHLSKMIERAEIEDLLQG